MAYTNICIQKDGNRSFLCARVRSCFFFFFACVLFFYPWLRHFLVHVLAPLVSITVGTSDSWRGVRGRHQERLCVSLEMREVLQLSWAYAVVFHVSSSPAALHHSRPRRFTRRDTFVSQPGEATHGIYIYLIARLSSRPCCDWRCRAAAASTEGEARDGRPLEWNRDTAGGQHCGMSPIISTSVSCMPSEEGRVSARRRHGWPEFPLHVKQAAVVSTASTSR